MFILSGKQGDYSLSIPEGIDFDAGRDILDTDDILRVLTTSAALSIVEAVHGVVTDEFPQRNNVDRLGRLSDKSEKAKDLLNERWKHVQKLEFKEAANHAEEAARLAQEAGDGSTRLRALRCAARDLGDHLIVTHLDEVEKRRFASRIGSHIETLEAVGLAEEALALEKAFFARLDGRADDALLFAEQADALTEDPETTAELLSIRLQAWWQKAAPEQGLKLVKQITAVNGRLGNSDSKLVLNTNWLRTLCRAGKTTDSDVKSFVDLAQNLVNDEIISPSRALLLIDEALLEFGRAGDLARARILLETAMGMAVRASDQSRSANIALQTAKIEAELGRENEARRFLGIADQMLDRYRATGDRTRWMSLRATALSTRGEIESLLARKLKETDEARSLSYYRSEHQALEAARSFVIAHEADLVGDVGPFCADLDVRLGESASRLGRMAEAVGHFRRARTDQIMTHPRLAERIGVRAWLGEAQTLLFNGQFDLAQSTLNGILTAPAAFDRQRQIARNNLHWIKEYVSPVTEWFSSAAAKVIHRQVAKEGLRAVIAEQIRPLVDWCKALPPRDDSCAGSELLDIWGRGGLARIVAAVRMDPCNAILVNASSIKEISRWARAFCPLYDTVLINWKGPLLPALGMVPMPDSLGPPGAFGGQGYMRTSDGIKDLEDWHIAIGWANYLPKDVARFLVTAALQLLRSGRLLVLPAPLVGCTQSAVGWVDNLFVDGFLGGVIQIAGTKVAERSMESPNPESRLLDLGAVDMPFIDNVPLDELDRILSDTVEWRIPLQRILRSSLGGNDMRQERWSGVGSNLTDIREACRQLEERWRSLTKTRSGQKWTLASMGGTLSAVGRLDESPGEDSLTDLLRAVAGGQPELGPWIPYWRLREVGGELDWIRPLDNRSKPPDAMAQAMGFAGPVQGWLFPGDGGPGMASSFRVSA